MTAWVIAYDIRDNRSRSKVAGTLKKHGLPIQKSVFLVEATREVVTELTESLAEGLDLKTDRVCAWPLRVEWQADQICRPPEATPLREIFIIA